jgi:hypothetical protein
MLASIYKNYDITSLRQNLASFCKANMASFIDNELIVFPPLPNLGMENSLLIEILIFYVYEKINKLISFSTNQMRPKCIYFFIFYFP